MQAMTSNPMQQILNKVPEVTVQCLDCGHSAKFDARALSDEAIRRNLTREIGAIE